MYLFIVSRFGQKRLLNALNVNVFYSYQMNEYHHLGDTSGSNPGSIPTCGDATLLCHFSLLPQPTCPSPAHKSISKINLVGGGGGGGIYQMSWSL